MLAEYEKEAALLDAEVKKIVSKITWTNKNEVDPTRLALFLIREFSTYIPIDKVTFSDLPTNTSERKSHANR
jgi:hypothetical protein